MKGSVVLISWIALSAILPHAAFARQTEPILTVQGSSEVRVAPDVAIVRLGAVAQAPMAETAQEQVATIVNRIFDAIDGVGIDRTQIQTANLVLGPVFSRQRPGDEVPEIQAYRASNSVSVRVEDLELVGAVVDAGLGAGANQLQGVVFDLSDDGPAREQALTQAILEARSKAEVMANALGVELESVLSVDEGGVFVQPLRVEAARLATFQDASPTPVAPGELTVSGSVTLRYRISQD